MLSTDRVRATVDMALRPMRHALALNGWTVTMYYGREDDDTKGSARIVARDRRVKINIDPGAHEDEADVLETLRHELLHVAHGYFELPRELLCQFLDGDSFDAVDVGFSLAAEHTVDVLELALDGLGLTPLVLVERGREMLEMLGERNALAKDGERDGAAEPAPWDPRKVDA